MTRRLDHTGAPASDPRSEGPIALFAGCGLALVVARHVLPAESAHLGETLWFVPLWLLMAIAWILVRQRFMLPRPPIDRGDWAVLLLAGGHVIAGLASQGNMRAAVNGATEWIGVAVAVGLLRRWLNEERLWQQFLAVLTTAGVVLAGLGVWQYAVEFPALRSEVGEFANLEERQASGAINQQQSTRLRQLRIELGQLATETRPNARFALRQRLMASTEPLACFALANTLAGVLTVALLLLLGGAGVAGSGQPAWLRIARIGAPALLVGFCLVLTKSRTAWIGLLAGATSWAFVELRGSLLSRRSLKLAVAGCLAMVALLGGAWSAGALDRLVLLEAPKSLRYRVEYWTGAWNVIRNHALFGVGPGNFRQNYLRYKVAGSSEEILDPHNLVLDVWAAGGLVALLGLVAAFGLAVARWRATASTASTAVAPADPSLPRLRMVLLSGSAGIALVWLKLGLIDLQWDTRLLALLGGWIAAALIVPRLRVSAASQMAAGVALGVHLLGAGGISMPVIATTLLLLWLGPVAPAAAAEPAPVRLERRRAIVTCVGLATLFGLSIVGAVIPSTLANLNIEAAMSVMRERGDSATARNLLEHAIDADPLDPQPHIYLAQLDFDASRSRTASSREQGIAAIGKLDQAIRLDPENPKTYWLKAQWELRESSEFGDAALALTACRTAQAAADRDPQNAEVLATLARACEEAGLHDKARASAARALELDALNLQLGHYDRLLDDTERELLRALLAISSK